MSWLQALSRILWALLLAILVGLLVVFNGGLLSLLVSTVDPGRALEIGFGFECLLVLGGLTAPGQYVLARLSRFRPPTSQEQQYLEAVFLRVHHRTQNTRPIVFHVMDIREVNAFALGSRHIGVTRGFFRLPAPQQEAILAHELGHLSGGDSILTGIVSMASGVGNWVGLIAGWIGLAVLGVGLLSGVGQRKKSAEGGAAFVLAGGLLGLSLLILLFRLFTTAVWSVYSRRMEYRADAFAARHGYREALAQALVRLDRPRYTARLGLAGTIWSSHPATWRRLRHLERLGAPIAVRAVPPGMKKASRSWRSTRGSHSSPAGKPALRRIRHF